MPNFLRRAKRYKPHLVGKKILFRHPWVADFSGKRGKQIMIRVARRTPVQQGELLEAIEQLLTVAPRYRDQVPRGLPEDLIERYFQAMEEEEDTVRLRIGVLDESDPEDPDSSVEIEGIRAKVRDFPLVGKLAGSSHDFATKVFEKLHHQEDRIRELEDEKASLQAQLDRLVHATGERSKAEKNSTVESCFAHFEKSFRVRDGASQEQHDDVVHRVKVVLEHLMTKKYGSVTVTDLKDALDASEPKSEFERAKRIHCVKRFFKHLCKPHDAGGMGFVGDPAAYLEARSVKAIQRERKKRGLVTTLDPRLAIESEKLDPYWKALVAVMGYAGLRLAECANLEWDMVDFDNKLIHIRPSNRYPKLKSYVSERDIRPFPNVWPILKAHKESLPEGTKLAFGRPTKPNKDWFVIKKKRPRATKLSDALGKKLKAIGITGEPNRRLRRFWETTMRMHGHGDLIVAMGGHSEEVGAEHYTKWAEVVKVAVIKKLGKKS